MNSPAILVLTVLVLSVLLIAALAASAWLFARMRRAVKQAETQENQLQAIVSTAADAIVTVDEQHRIVMFNPAAEHMFGRAAATVLGEDVGLLIPVRFRAGHRQHVARFGKEGVSLKTMNGGRDVVALRADGTEFLIDASISRATALGKRLYTVVARDMTERHRFQNALRESEMRYRELARSLQRVREDERAVLARRLHEGLGQPLTALKMEMSALDAQTHRDSLARIEGESDAARALRENVDGLVDHLVALVRSLASELRPPMLDDLGLAAALDWLAGDLATRYGLRVALDVTETELDRDVATVLYRIVQETLDDAGRQQRDADFSLVLGKAGGLVVLSLGEEPRRGADAGDERGEAHDANGANGTSGPTNVSGTVAAAGVIGAAGAAGAAGVSVVSQPAIRTPTPAWLLSVQERVAALGGRVEYVPLNGPSSASPAATGGTLAISIPHNGEATAAMPD
ncbi:sensor histidine kinase [Paraburkholderia kururiensis]|uniref:sensor histidine kinase n=1 Tax=Paraburkholderia kururiensis TaxID=984307 RepID=UPI00034510C6|nr:PAS domain S-box protein [Paraburkholderia kururiensis]